MALSNAERQRRFKQRKRQQAKPPLLGNVGNVTSNDRGHGNRLDQHAEPPLSRPQTRRREYQLLRQHHRNTDLTVTPIKRGPPRKFSTEIADRILAGVLEHGSLEKACSQPGMPDSWSVYRWMMHEPDFVVALARVREISSERWLDEMMQIADDESLDPMSRKVRTETRRWAITAVAPGRYGGKAAAQAAALGGAVQMTEMSDAELDALERLAQIRAEEQGPIVEGEAVEEPGGEDESSTAGLGGGSADG